MYGSPRSKPHRPRPGAACGLSARASSAAAAKPTTESTPAIENNLGSHNLLIGEFSIAGKLLIAREQIFPIVERKSCAMSDCEVMSDMQRPLPSPLPSDGRVWRVLTVGVRQ